LWVVLAVLALGLGFLRLVVWPHARTRPLEESALGAPPRAEPILASESTSARRTPLDARDPRDAGSRIEREASESRAHGPHSPAARRAEMRALVRCDPAAFDRRIAALAAGTVPDTDQFPLFQVAYEEQRPASAAELARAITSLSLASGAERQAVPRACVRFLGQRAAREPRARETLDAIAWSAAPDTFSALRVQAVRELVLSTPEEELPLFTQRLHGERDEVLHTAGLAALEERAHPAPSDSFEEFP
jgi:hypothetical protein